MYLRLDINEEDKEKIEKYLKRLGIQHDSSKSIEELYVVDKIRMLEEGFREFETNVIPIYKMLSAKDAMSYKKNQLLALQLMMKNAYSFSVKNPLFGQLEHEIINIYENTYKNIDDLSKELNE